MERDRSPKTPYDAGNDWDRFERLNLRKNREHNSISKNRLICFSHNRQHSRRAAFLAPHRLLSGIKRRELISVGLDIVAPNFDQLSDSAVALPPFQVE